MIITSHMQQIIQIYPCLLKLSRKQDTILKIGDFSTKNKDFPPKPLLQIFPCKNRHGSKFVYQNASLINVSTTTIFG
jgi:hypothetical protein